MHRKPVAGETSPSSVRSRARSNARLLGLMCAVAFYAGCGGGGDSNPVAGPSPAPAPASAPGPAPAPAPAPTPSPAPAPAPSPVPPLSAPQAFGADTGTAFWAQGDTATGGQGQTISGYTCPFGSSVYHRHAHLSIFLDGQLLQVPANIGLTATCDYGLHTHDGTGELHVEPSAQSLAARAPDLGLFFEIWGQPLSRSDVAGLTGQPIVVYVKDAGDTQVTEWTGDLAALELISQREITIVVGTPPAQIPTYVWDHE